MFSWKDYYIENERRQSQIDNARHYLLIKACCVARNKRSMAYQYRIRGPQSACVKTSEFRRYVKGKKRIHCEG